jgi:hypothetical protein
MRGEVRIRPKARARQRLYFGAKWYQKGRKEAVFAPGMGMNVTAFWLLHFVTN